MPGFHMAIVMAVDTPTFLKGIFSPYQALSVKGGCVAKHTLKEVTTLYIVQPLYCDKHLRISRLSKQECKSLGCHLDSTWSCLP